MNGYFQLHLGEEGTKLKLFPPTEGGNAIDINELTSYLAGKGIAYEMTAVNQLLMNLKQPLEYALDADTRYPEKEMFMISLSADHMTATARFFPPSNEGKFLTKEDILHDLKYRKIVFGVQTDIIDAYLENRQYCTDIIIARGKAPIHGKDAIIEYHFNTDLKARPTLNEDGSVDFFHLNNINICKKEDILATLYKETQGEYGATVSGEKIKPRDVKKAVLKYGRNITLSEDRTRLVSDVDGHVSLVGDKVFVSDVYEVENVDNSTGNIEFEGSVQINGNVRTGFSVKAKGNVEIRGVVEGAFIEAGESIIIARGMNGMSRGVLKANGNIIAKFIENSTVISGGFVETESIIHCTVMAKTEVIVVGKKGFITGGRICAANAVNVKHLGSPMGADTIVEVGVDPMKKAKYLQLQKSIVELKKELDVILPSLQANKDKMARGARIQPEQIAYFKQMVETAKQKQVQYESETKEFEELQELIEGDSDAHINVTGEVYAGTKIAISDVSMLVNESIKYCRFVKRQGAVSMTSL